MSSRSTLTPQPLKAQGERAWITANQARDHFLAVQLAAVAWLIRQWFPDATHITIDTTGVEVPNAFGMRQLRLATVRTGADQVRWIAAPDSVQIPVAEKAAVFDGPALQAVTRALTGLMAFGFGNSMLEGLEWFQVGPESAERLVPLPPADDPLYACLAGR